MTADHWIQIAIGLMNFSAAVTAAVVPLVIASRQNHPMQKQETAKPRSTAVRIPMLLLAPWFLPGILVVADIFGLHLDLRYPLTPHRVLLIAFHAAAIGFALSTAMTLIIVQLRSEEHTSELQSLRHLVC